MSEAANSPARTTGKNSRNSDGISPIAGKGSDEPAKPSHKGAGTLLRLMKKKKSKKEKSGKDGKSKRDADKDIDESAREEETKKKKKWFPKM